ncbi:MAG: DUF2683 family protein [Pelobium sp.]
METLVIHPENKEQLDALKALAKSWRINFEKYPYSTDFINKVKEREQNLAKGESVNIANPKSIWESIL